MTVAVDTGRQVGCPQCGYVFTPDRVRACVECHRARCRCKPQLAIVPINVSASMDPGAMIGYCPDCGQRGPLFYDVSAAVSAARARAKESDRRAHLAGHRGRTTLSCGYCRAGHPTGQLNEGAGYR